MRCTIVVLSLVLGFFSPFEMPVKAVAKQLDCHDESVFARMRDGSRGGTVTIDIVTNSFDSSNEAAAEAKKVVKWVNANLYDEVNSDHSQDEDAIELEMTALSGIHWDMSPEFQAGAVGFWLDGNSYTVIYVTKTMDSGAPLEISKELFGVARIVQENGDIPVVDLLNDADFLDTNKWKNQSPEILGCK